MTEASLLGCKRLLNVNDYEFDVLSKKYKTGFLVLDKRFTKYLQNVALVL